MENSNHSLVGERFYYADGKKIPLSVSPRFLAVRATGQGVGARNVATSLAEKLSTIAAPTQVLEVPEYNLAVIALPQSPSTASLARGADVVALQSMVDAEPDLAAGPQVYEAQATEGQSAVIPVGEILVKFNESTSVDTRRKLLEKNGLEVKQENYPEPGAYLVTTKSEADTIEIANKLQESEPVEFAQPNFVHLTPKLSAEMLEGIAEQIAGKEVNGEAKNGEGQQQEVFDDVTLAGPTAPPTDPGFASQWNLQKIRAPQAWEISGGSASISVAIIDEGNDMSHEDLSYKLPGYDAFAVDNNPQPNGNDAHGTACGGVAAMRMNNARGGVGVAPGCKIMPIRIAQGIGGGFWSTTDAKVADGIRKAVDAPRSADVLSNSYGLGPSTTVTNAFKYAQTNGRGGKGCPIAAAAGNGNTPPVIYPANLSPTIPGFMAVSATNEWDQRKSKTSLDGETWWGSSYGPEVDIAAPGVHIYASDITGGAGYGGGNYVPNFNGTSSATPHVAGLMALILSVDPALRSWEVEDIIKLTADDLGPGGRDPEFGFGRINCRRALEAASRVWYAISITPQFLGAGKECFMRIRLRMYNPGINTVRLDALTLTSHNPTWTAEIDRFEYRPNPGSVLAPRTSQEVRFNNILLKANGNQQAWSYRWALNWNYTFWRPGSPGFPLLAAETLSEATEVRAQAHSVKGGKDGEDTSRARRERTSDGFGYQAPVSFGDAVTEGTGDLVTVERSTRAITIVVR